ncbi:hypothetical protein AVEN_12663-1 [Araneus ventricosus]|uniref:DUF4817 domain-containing protein n=1 Tax=Araneus ventricosus TaxID=182803 RepID=A0A4Y2ACN9_ARAVE|nr:hypothetical protein AVEN_12663-1 [Araneus ventricosus]
MEAIFGQNVSLISPMSDEARFLLNVMVNQQNCRYWASENLRELHERLLHRATSKSKVRCLKECTPFSKSAFRIASVITDTTWEMFSTLYFVKCYFNTNSAM